MLKCPKETNDYYRNPCPSSKGFDPWKQIAIRNVDLVGDQITHQIKDYELSPR